MDRTRAVRLLGLVVACALSGACATTRYTQSRVTALPPGAKGATGGAASLQLDDDLRVRIEPLDRAMRGSEVPNLGLRVAFEPRVLGYSFDPGQVVLRTVDGREWRAPGGEYRPILDGASFDVAFPAPVRPGEAAELEIGGLARGPQRLAPVRLRLARRDAVSSRLTPGAEKTLLNILAVPLVILAAPVAMMGGGY